jgi:hypothetical protein
MKNSTLSFKKWLVVTAGLLFMASGVSLPQSFLKPLPPPWVVSPLYQ